MSKKMQYDFRQCRSLEELTRMLHDKAEEEGAEKPSENQNPISDAPSSTGGVQTPTVVTGSRSGSSTNIETVNGVWGEITGDISSQDDLWAYLSQIGTAESQRYYVKYVDSLTYVEWVPRENRMEFWINGVLVAVIHSPGWLQVRGTATLLEFSDNKEIDEHIEYNSTYRQFEFGLFQPGGKYYRVMTLSKAGLRVGKITQISVPAFSFGFASGDWVDLQLLKSGSYKEGRLVLRRMTLGCENLS